MFLPVFTHVLNDNVYKMCVEQKSLKFKNCLAVIERHNILQVVGEKNTVKHKYSWIRLLKQTKNKQKHCFNRNNMPNR